MNESTFYGTIAKKHLSVLVSYDIEPFSDTYGEHATDSAFPHANSPKPLNLYYSWNAKEDDRYWRNIMANSVNHLKEVAKKEGIYREDM